jgi:Skp family chaperone for outer membrane proteins
MNRSRDTSVISRCAGRVPAMAFALILSGCASSSEIDSQRQTLEAERAQTEQRWKQQERDIEAKRQELAREQSKMRDEWRTRQAEIDKKREQLREKKEKYEQMYEQKKAQLSNSAQ